VLPAVNRHEDRLVGRQASVMLGVQEIVSDPFEGPVVGHQDLVVSDPAPGAPAQNMRQRCRWLLPVGRSRGSLYLFQRLQAAAIEYEPRPKLSLRQDP
jgi:hypothetical protein